MGLMDFVMSVASRRKTLSRREAAQWAATTRSPATLAAQAAATQASRDQPSAPLENCPSFWRLKRFSFQ
jgi:hypothetical protein